jgi:hypothetical protein
MSTAPKLNLVSIEDYLAGELRSPHPVTHADAVLLSRFSVTCEPNPPTDSFLDKPAALFEVRSRGIRRLDEGEKKDAYLTIPSLAVYLLIEQETPRVTVYRRGARGFDREIHERRGRNCSHSQCENSDETRPRNLEVDRLRAADSVKEPRRLRRGVEGREADFARGLV